MDESWRMRMGMANMSKPNLPCRRSTEETRIFGESDNGLEPEDFSDVFGGPPRSVLSRQFSAGTEFARSMATSFYDEVFRLPDGVVTDSRAGRSLPEFRIPGSQKTCDDHSNFYGDVFGSNGDIFRSRSRSRSWSNSKSKTTSSSVLSSEELSPLRPAIANDDVPFSLLASRLRPINVRNSSMMIQEEYPGQEEIPAFPYNHSSYVEKQFVENEYIDSFRSPHYGFPRRVSSPETISINPNSYGSFRVSVEDVELNSLPSVVSSICQDQEVKVNKVQDEVMQEECMDEEEDEAMSSYVIEISSDHRVGETDEALGIDEAIAWAKEKFQTHCPKKDGSMRHHEKDNSAEIEEKAYFPQFGDSQNRGDGSTESAKDEKQKRWEIEEEKQLPGRDMELELLDEGIRFWSVGKEANICLLLSTLHQILWPNSGWYPIPLTSLKENSHVKKAYQKARLCLHPDKLQQRGATVPQKYVADKAFSILQDAWTAYISKESLIWLKDYQCGKVLQLNKKHT